MTASGDTTRSPWDLDRQQWAEVLSGEPKFRVDQLWRGLTQQQTAPSDLTVLPARLRADLAEQFQPQLSPLAEHRSSDGQTEKWLWHSDANNAPAEIETVLMRYPKRATVCVSSQAGCAMGCTFCATGQAGYERHLSVGEILEQVVAAQRAAEPRRVSNVVFMGMGEPFANYDRVLTSLHRLLGDFGLGARHITVSTVGLVPQIRRFAAEGLQVSLAVSVHAANDDLRNELVPINRRYPLAELVDACAEFRARTGRRVSIEWALIDGVNDRAVDAAELAALAGLAKAHVNLIPLNPTPGFATKGSPPDRVASFAHELRQRGTNATVRQNRGVDIDAACGQLRFTHQQSAPAPQPVKIGRHANTEATGG